MAGPATVDPRNVGDRPMSIRLTFDQPLQAVRRAEATSGNAAIVGFTPGNTEVIVEVEGVSDAGFATISVIDVVGVDQTSPVIDAAIGVSPGDFAMPARIYDLDDIDAFIHAFLADAPLADMDLSGMVDLQDIDAFITAFLALAPAEPRPPRVTPIDDAFAPSGSIGRPVRFTIRDDRVFEDDLVLTVTSANPALLPESNIELIRNGGEIDLLVTGPAGANGQTTVTVEASNGFETTQRSLAVTVRPDAPPTAKFTIDPFLGEAPLPVEFDARRSVDELDNIASYAWDFGDGTGASGAVASHTYGSPGIYAVSLTVTDDSGLIDTFERVVTVAGAGYDPAAAPIDRFAAKRFLYQAAFGPTEADIAFVRANGYEAWIDNQLFAIPATPFDYAVFQQSNAMGFGGDNPKNYFDDYAVEAPDQLRQRIAWALIQIIVMNLDQNNSSQEANSLYYSAYINEATGNYRDLLDFVTYSYQMGFYLTYLTSSVANPDTGSVPDENYAREVKQLFTIGLDQIDERGVPVRDVFGDRIPLYDNECITEFARVFTGLRRDGGSEPPLVADEDDHDFGAKQLLDYPGAIPAGGVLPAGDGSAFAVYTDVGLALDNLFYHPNTPPFIAKLLIQRFVTSNPTGDYVERVAQAFKGLGPYGSGQRGDLAATVKAILLDSEARNPAYSANPAFGKPIEPILIALSLMRSTGRVMNPDRPFPMNRITLSPFRSPEWFGQGFMASPSVFNFYLPDFTLPETTLDRAGLASPELQIHTTTTNFNTPNETTKLIFGSSDYDDIINAAANLDDALIVDLLVDQWYHRPLSPEIRDVIVQALIDIDSDNNGVRAAAWLLLSNPEFTVLR
ncbi:MAG: DUF1800 family protein [Planctomycetota bacterium]